MSELPKYSLKEVARRDGKEESRVWIVIHDMVYDVTSYRHEVGQKRVRESNEVYLFEINQLFLK